MSWFSKRWLGLGLSLLVGVGFIGCGTAAATVPPATALNAPTLVSGDNITPTPFTLATPHSKKSKKTPVPATPVVDSAPLTHGPIVGAVSDTAARVFVRTNRASSAQIRYGTQPDLSDAMLSSTQQTDSVTDFTTQIPLANLAASTVYYLNVLVNGKAQLSAPYPHFKTFPPPGSAANFSFVQLTDFSLTQAYYSKSFLNADKDQPDFVLLGGDFPHGTRKDLDSKRGFFKGIYSPATGPSISDFVHSILQHYAVVHMWDDHDYGVDNGDRTYANKAESLQVLRDYFPTYPMTQYGDWQRFSYGQADFFMLDSRSERDPDLTPNGPAKSMLDGDHLGAAGQLAWLENGLKSSTARWKFIITPVPFNKTSKPADSWAAFPAERQKLVDFFHSNNIKNIIFIAGDLHMGGIDSGANSEFPEMVNNGANGPGCQSTDTPGTWDQGMYTTTKGSCMGYGLVTVMTNPDRVLLQVKDSDGQVRVSYTVNAH